MSDVPKLHLCGYGVIETEHEDSLKKTKAIGLAWVLKDEAGNVIQQSDDVDMWIDKPENYPKREVLRQLCEAICRYQNINGYDYPSFPSSPRSSLPNVELPKDWVLYHVSTEEYIYQHKDKKRYLRVVEGQFTEELDQDQIIELITGTRPNVLTDSISGY